MASFIETGELDEQGRPTYTREIDDAPTDGLKWFQRILIAVVPLSFSAFILYLIWWIVKLLAWAYLYFQGGGK